MRTHPLSMVGVSYFRFIVIDFFLVSCFNPLMHLNHFFHTITIICSNISLVIYNSFINITDSFGMYKHVILCKTWFVNIFTDSGSTLGGVKHLCECDLLLFILP